MMLEKFVSILYFPWATGVILVVYLLINEANLPKGVIPIGNMAGAVILFYGIYGVGRYLLTDEQIER